MSFSNSSGGTLALPSPTHAHHIDVTSAVRTLRRSMSRSPSKFLSRTNSHTSSNSDASQQASPQSPCRRFGSTPEQQQQQPLPSYTQSAPPLVSAIHASTPHQSVFTPFRSSVRLSLRSAKAARTSPRPLTRARISPKSPLKRALNAASDSGNPLPPSTLSSTLEPAGQENNTTAVHSPVPRKVADKPSRHSLHLDVSGSSQSGAFLKSLDTNVDTHMTPSTGALKRSDATMNLDQPSQGSPVAKRRSLHGISLAGQNEELNVFGSNATTWPNFHIHEDTEIDYELSSVSAGLGSTTPTANVPKRSSSLRKSTLQQRYGERGSLGRRTGERQLAQLSSEFSPGRSRPRLSLDQFLPPHIPRDSPFSSNIPLPNASTHPMDTKNHQPHPLSKTLTTSSSGNSLTEERPLYAPAPRADRPRPHPFSRSLPLNAVRPTRSNDPSKGVATPNKPGLWVDAFHSTGLVSKINRHPEEEADKKLAPPDTPCKKHSNPFATYPPPAGSASAMKKRGNNRNSFGGLPSTPFNPVIGQLPDTFGMPGKGLSIFQRGNASRNSRRGSVLSLDGEDKLFGDINDSQTSLEGYAPPTPTKNTLSTNTISNDFEKSLDTTWMNPRESPSANRHFAPPTSAVRPTISRESTSSPVNGRRTPQTPQESLLPLDTSRLSISQSDAPDSMRPPVTPTAGRDFRSSTSLLVTPVNARTTSVDVDPSLSSRFESVEQIGKGEFSMVYRVTREDHRQNAFDALVSTTPTDRLLSPAKSQVFAVKKTKHPYQGQRDRQIKLQEAQILKNLSHADHVVKYIDDWEHNNHLYIQTEFCEEGTLDKFLNNVGRGGRLDDFRIFKILQDLCLGLKEIHDAGFMHLDLKPANVLITFEGVLKIGDFGLAQECSSTSEGVDIEGDREYMAPEMLKGKATRSADMFSLGLMTLEAAGNVALPDNGPTWVALRSGDLSEVPSLTWTPSMEIDQKSIGHPTEPSHLDEFGSGRTHDAGNLFGPFKRSELQQPPEFMVSSFHPSSLDAIVRWTTAQEPEQRPTADQVLDLEGLRWVAERRSAPATVYEGHWGPDAVFSEFIGVPPSLDMDTEMTDV